MVTWSLIQIVKVSTLPTNQSVNSLIRRVSSGPLIHLSTGVSLTSGNSARPQLLAGEVHAHEHRDEQHRQQQPAARRGDARQPLAAAGVLGGPARQPLEHDGRQHHAHAARRADVGPAGASLAGGGGGAVEHDRHEDDGQAGDGGGTHVERLERRDHGLAEAGTVDQRRDGGHRQRGHHALVDADHDGAAGHRQLHLAEHLAAGEAQRPGRLLRRRRDRADAVLGDPDDRAAARR